MTCQENSEICAENLAADQLEGNPDPKTLEFNRAVRPRTKEEIDRCDDCEDKYGEEKKNEEK